MTESQDRLTQLNALKEQRKNGEIGPLEYYRGLLRILADTVQNLRDEDISETDAKTQTPLILVFLEEQIAKLGSRGG